MAENIFSFIFTNSLALCTRPIYSFISIMSLTQLQAALELFCFLVIPALMLAFTITKK